MEKLYLHGAFVSSCRVRMAFWSACMQVTAEGGQEKPVVLFAGEATHRQLTGTMAGAFLSGQRAARMVMSCAK